MPNQQRLMEESLAPQCRADFMRAAGTTPEAFLDIATQGMPAPRLREVKYDDPGVDYFTVRYAGDGYTDIYTLNFNTRTVGAGAIINERPDRGTGRYMFGLRAVAGLAFRFKTMEVSAALEMGGYVWARAGVKVKREDKRFLRFDLRRRLETLKDIIDPHTYEKVSELIKLRHAGDLQAIANLQGTLRGADKIWDMARRCELRGAEEYREKRFTPYAEYVRKGYLPANGLITLGQYLLCGIEYEGYINLRDAKQMAQIEAYCRMPIRAMARAQRKTIPQAAAA